MNFSIVIPAYNESDNIKITIQELLNAVEKIPDIHEVQLIVVDDHSNDNTYETVVSINDPRVACLRLSRQSGSHTALRAGLKEAKGDAVLCISADGQDDPACVESMWKKWRDNVKIVWALRINRNDEPLYTRFLAKTFYRIMLWLIGAGTCKIDLSRADFYLLDNVVVKAVNSCPERNTSLFGLIAWMGFNQDFIEYERRPRRFGKSKWNFTSRFSLAKDWIMAFSGLPLKSVLPLGLTVALFGFLYALYVIINAYIGNPVEGWSSIIVVVLLLGGIQMIMLGIFGEYLWRNINESRRRPLYFIEEKEFRDKQSFDLTNKK